MVTRSRLFDVSVIFCIEPIGEIFHVSPKYHRASPNVKTPPAAPSTLHAGALVLQGSDPAFVAPFYAETDFRPGEPSSIEPSRLYYRVLTRASGSNVRARVDTGQ